MKKLLLTTVAVAAFAGSAVADDQFYVSAGVLGSKSPKVSFFGDTKFENKKFNMGVDLGVGYGLMDNVRTELVYNHMFENKMKEKDDSASKYKQSARALMVRGFVDLADLGPANLHVGAGLGWGQVKAKATDADADAVDGSSKNKNTLAWSLHAGAGFDVADGVKLDVGYSYRDFGKTKDLRFNNTAVKSTAKSVRSHNISAGVRFDI